MSDNWTLSVEGRESLRALLREMPDHRAPWRPMLRREGLAPVLAGADEAFTWVLRGDTTVRGLVMSKRDADLLCGAINALPGLLDLVDELEAEVGRLQQAIEARTPGAGLVDRGQKP